MNHLLLPLYIYISLSSELFIVIKPVLMYSYTVHPDVVRFLHLYLVLVDLGLLDLVVAAGGITNLRVYRPAIRSVGD